MRLVVVLWAAVVAEGRRGVRAEASGIDMTFVNPFEGSRELFWLRPGTEEAVAMGVIEGNYGESRLTTYEGHSFGWRGVEECAEAFEGRVTMDRRVTRYELGDEWSPPIEESEKEDPFEAVFANKSPWTMRVATRNASVTIAPRASERLVVSRGEHADWTRDGELLYRSVVERYGQSPHVFKDEVHTRLCSDETPATPPVRVERYEEEGRAIEILVLREDPWIVVARNWTATEDCESLEAQARATGLSGAQVFGQQAIIADRRALSANVYWDRRNDASVNNRLIRRAFALAKAHRGYDIHPGPAQEPLNFIHYGYGEEYRPHCDGVCHRAPYARGGRVATLIHYCKAPTAGGATVFPRIRTKVVPRDHDALLFAYKRDDGYMDDGHTLHTGCLVKHGDKQIVTMWMREDVTDDEPWSDFLS